jgi:5-methylcytosine-specific restriction protein A
MPGFLFTGALLKNNWPTTSKQSRGYGAAWEKLRLVILRRDNGLCQCDQCKGGELRLTPANEVHHVVGKAIAKRMGWTQAQMDDPGNLAAIAHDCHVRVTIEEKGQRPKPRIGIDGYGPSLRRGCVRASPVACPPTCAS